MERKFMQTFLPYESVVNSLNILDNKRLNKQILEAKQILNCLKVPNRWKNHPAVKMYKGYEFFLSLYYNEAIKAWINRGFKNTMEFVDLTSFDNQDIPYWLGDERLHKSHRCNLLRKNFDYYSNFFEKDLDIDAPYWWPTGLTNKKNNDIMIKYWDKKERGI